MICTRFELCGWRLLLSMPRSSWGLCLVCVVLTGRNWLVACMRDWWRGKELAGLVHRRCSTEPSACGA